MTTNSISVKKEEEIPESFTGTILFRNGDRFHFVNGLPHRTDGPAKEFADGTMKWYFEGRFIKRTMIQVPGPGNKFKKWTIHNSFDTKQEFLDSIKDLYEIYISGKNP